MFAKNFTEPLDIPPIKCYTKYAINVIKSKHGLVIKRSPLFLCPYLPVYQAGEPMDHTNSNTKTGSDHTFFQNRSCQYFPCHHTTRPTDFNCLFCYCPLYALGKDCGGNFHIPENGIKDCSGCLIPHQRENYDFITDKCTLLCKLIAEQNG